MQLAQRADEHEIDGIAGQPVAGDGVARHPLALEDLEAHANGARKDDVGRYCVGGSQREDPRQPVVGKLEDDEHNQPDAEDAQCQHEQALQEAFQRSQHPPAMVFSVMSAAGNRPGNDDQFNMTGNRFGAAPESFSDGASSSFRSGDFTPSHRSG